MIVVPGLEKCFCFPIFNTFNNFLTSSPFYTTKIHKFFNFHKANKVNIPLPSPLFRNTPMMLLLYPTCFIYLNNFVDTPNFFSESTTLFTAIVKPNHNCSRSDWLKFFSHIFIPKIFNSHVDQFQKLWDWKWAFLEERSITDWLRFTTCFALPLKIILFLFKPIKFC